MTTNLNAIAGPSKLTPPPHLDPDSPGSSVSDSKDLLHRIIDPTNRSASAGQVEDGTGRQAVAPGGVSKPGLSVDENGEVIKVPAFLQKLYSMVSDDSTDALIYWSSSGDSFFVPNHERFGKEILPRFFKHSNFSSFVRQLNMYGFHKVPQPQSGVLRADNPNDSELWEFINPFFKRGHPHLLSKVMRKNNRPGNPPAPSTSSAPASGGTRSSARQASQNAASGFGSQYLITDGSTEGEAGGIGTISGDMGNNQQLIDLKAITSGIAAIRQTQASIGADLKALQASNEHLWREALESRDRHRKHQETIDLIVSFLERLFGTEGEGLKGLKEALRRGGIGRPREDSTGEEGVVTKKRKRFGIDRMISDGREEMPIVGSDLDDQIVEIQDEPHDVFNSSIPRFSRTRSDPTSASATSEPWTSTSGRFQQLPSEDDNSPRNIRSVRSSGVATPLDPFGAFTPLNPNNVDPTALVPYFNQQNANIGSYNPNLNNDSTTQANASNNSGTGIGAPPMSPTTSAAAASAFNLDPSILQTTIGSLLQSPAAAQMFLNSLSNSVQGQGLQTPSKLSQSNVPSSYPFNAPSTNSTYPGQNAPGQGAQMVNPQLQQIQQVQQGYPASGNGINPDIDPTLALFSPLPNYNGLMQSNDALLKSYQDAAGIGTDVDKLQESIDHLVRSMGLDLANGQGGAEGQNGLSGVGAQANLNVPSADGTGVGGAGSGAGVLEDYGLSSDFDVDEFLDNLGKGDDQPS